MLHHVPNILCATALLAFNARAQSIDPGIDLQYGENWAAIDRDSDLVAANFPDIANITLHSPAFLDPESVSSRFSNGSEGPTDDIQMENFYRTLAARNDWLTYEVADFLSEEGKAIPFLFLSLPNNGNETKLRVYIQAAIHGNEPSADQSVMALLGKMDAEPSWATSILEKMDVKILPRYNMDGVAYFQRQLACSLDPNRDHIKLMREQTRDIKQRINEWNPHISIDMHEYTANTIMGGQYNHASDSMMSGGMNPNIHPDIREQLHDVWIPAIGEELERYGLRWEYYSTATPNRTEGSTPRLSEAVTDSRTGRNAIGLTQTLSFLFETRGIRLADQHFQRRVVTNLLMIETVLERASDDTEEIYNIIENARQEFTESEEDFVVTDKSVVENGTFTLVDINNGNVSKYPVEYVRRTPPMVNITRERPEAYIIPRTYSEVATRLEVLGVEVQRIPYKFNGTVERMIIEKSTVNTDQYEGVYMNTVSTRSSERQIVLPPGSFRVSTRQQNAALAFIALEPENVDSFVSWNIIPVKEQEENPIFRIPRS